MGQAAVDLPDPLQAPSAAAGNDADDLISQLAGAEIDRLLSAKPEAEAEEVDELSDETADAAPAESSAESVLPTISEAAVSETPAEAAPAVAEPTVDPAEVAEVASAVSPDPAEVDASSPAPAESDASTSDAPEATVAEVLDAALADSGDAGPPNLLVRVLEAINSPMAMMPDGLREALGKLAILTAINAIAILVYVMLFRKQ